MNKKITSNIQSFVVGMFFLVSIFSFSGCSWIPSVGPDYERPQDPDVAGWILDEKGEKLFSTALEPRTSWWKNFNDPLLDQLIDDGVKKNLTLGMANDRLLQARAAQLGAFSRFLPSADASYSLSRQLQSNRTPIGQFFSSIFNQFQLGFDAAWEIDIFGGTRRAYESSKALFDAAKASADDVGVSVASEIARTYIEYIAFKQRVDIAQNNAKSQSDSKDLVQVRFDAGVVSDLDLQQSISLLETTNATIPTLIGERDARLYRLAVLLGQPPQTFSLPEDKVNDKHLVWSQALAIQQPSEILRIRPDVRAAERQLAAAVADVGVSMAEIFPKLNIVGGIGLQAFNSSQLMEKDSKYWNIGPQLSMPIFQGGRIYSNIKGSRRRADEALKNYELTVLTALEDAQNSLNAYKNSLDRIESLRNAVTASKRALSISQDLYNQGLADFQRVLESQRALFSSEDTLLQGEQQTFLAAISVYKAFAGGLEEEKKDL